MGQYTSSLIRKDHKLADRTAAGHDHSEQVRELRELQRSLSRRIRNVQSGARYSHPGDNG